MHALEASDRRVKLDTETLEAGQVFSHGYFLEQTVQSVRLREVCFSGFGILNCHFEGGQWLGVKLTRVDLACVCFRHVYFESIDFSDCTFASVVFESCVFSDCQFATDSVGFEKKDCYETATAKPKASEESPATSVVGPHAEPVVAKPPPNAVQDRFDRIER